MIESSNAFIDYETVALKLDLNCFNFLKKNLNAFGRENLKCNYYS